MFDDAIGRTEQAEDTITPGRMAQIIAMLGLNGGQDEKRQLCQDGAALPPLFHLFFANNASDRAALDHDGHEKLGRFIPDVSTAGPFHRRMWAAGDIRQDGALKVGEVVHRRSTITAIDQKHGSTGPLLFVTVERVLSSGSGQVVEERTLVYRDIPKPGLAPGSSDGLAPDSVEMAGAEGMTEAAVWTPDAPQLFRFSALTWNAHRIHYDLAHCRETEGYPDLVTHGPFTALMLANLTAEGLRFGGHQLTRFRFRGTQAMFTGRAVHLMRGANGKLEARNHKGQLAMTATREG
ncbi:MAG: MaoC family dehydratase N-terminal domain-containing protein [Alphaproteobacteria bacterium]|nr:MaoC family dehydratase N-terminal domain-containing protein [Alphaproteobacteria bacterium]